VEREAAGEDLSGGDSRPERSSGPRDHGDRGDRGGDRDAQDSQRRTRHRTRGHHE